MVQKWSQKVVLEQAGDRRGSPKAVSSWLVIQPASRGSLLQEALRDATRSRVARHRLPGCTTRSTLPVYTTLPTLPVPCPGTPPWYTARVAHPGTPPWYTAQAVPGAVLGSCPLLGLLFQVVPERKTQRKPGKPRKPRKPVYDGVREAREAQEAQGARITCQVYSPLYYTRFFRARGINRNIIVQGHSLCRVPRRFTWVLDKSDKGDKVVLLVVLAKVVILVVLARFFCPQHQLSAIGARNFCHFCHFCAKEQELFSRYKP